MITESGRKQWLINGGVLFLLLAFTWTGTALAAASADGFWQEIPQDRIVAKGERRIVPDRFRTFGLNIAALESALALAPPERSGRGAVSISLPMPDGAFLQFRVENSPIMEPGLAQRHPEITTYVAVAVDNPATTARLDLTPAGFHAIIFAMAGTVYIDPFQTGSREEYISYFKRDLTNPHGPFHCGVTGENLAASIRERNRVAAITPVGNTLRTYRLAVAATGEYTAFHGGTVNLGQAAIVTVINRVTGIYERELSIRLSLVANNHLLVYTNPATDPYSNGDGSALLSQNQSNVDNVIGSANYDVGHVFSTGGGGLARLGVVCTSSSKAQGETGMPSPVGDPFSVDYVAHELGHQFGGNHTFNGGSGSCAGGNRNAGTAYEPGSGSTIQAYAGICGAENLQPNSDDYFHTVSFDEMTAYTTGAGACSSNSPTGNNIPAAPAMASFTVPVSTPLMLSTAAGADPDDGQVLTYAWEQFDLGPQGPPNTDDGNRPIFRSFPPSLTPVRYLPRMSDLLSGTSTFGESMATTDRTLTFRLTVRDNAAGGGGVNYSTVAHQTTTSAGPFAVTSQSTPTDWVAGSTQTVTWNVANTSAAPVSCANVDILFSDTEFAGFNATTLLANTPNDGSQNVTAPFSANGPGRVMVKCSSNIFFDLNDAPITLIGGSVCGDSLLGAGEQCDDGNATGGDGCSATCQVEPGWSCTAPEPPVAGSESLPDGGFEGGTSSSAWEQFSTNFGTPLCDAACGIPPLSGDWFVWFGGIDQFEEGSVQQSVAIDTTASEITFARQLASCDSGDDYVRLMLDGNTVWERDGADPACGEAEPVTESIDLTTALGGPYNDGLSHTIRFESTIHVTNGSHSNFFIDDASILVGGEPPVPSQCTYIGGDEYTVGGNVVGLAGSGLLLRNNGGDDLPIAANGSFTFATPLIDGSDYSVSIASQPTGLSQTCSLENFNGTLAGADVTDVVVTCVTNTFSVGGTVSGLEGSGLVLQNNLADDLAIVANGDFTFAGALADGSSYSATVLTQPGAPDQTCSVDNASGTLAGAAVTSITVSCVNNGVCGDSLLGGGEQCDDGNAAGGDGCSATCQIEPGWSCTAPEPPVEGSNILPEGDFEGGTPSPAWAESSANFGTPICDAGCGIQPIAGAWFAWFGGIEQFEEGSVQQDIAIDATASEMTFKRQLADCDSVNDFVRLMLDGNTVWEKNGADPDCGETEAVTETIDLATAPGGPYNDGQSHTIRFESTINAANGGASNFYIDDASILTSGSPAVPSECAEEGFIFKDGFESVNQGSAGPAE